MIQKVNVFQLCIYISMLDFFFRNEYSCLELYGDKEISLPVSSDVTSNCLTMQFHF